MRSALCRMMVIVLLVSFLAPGLVQARPPAVERNQVSLSDPVSLFTKVWDLLASLWRDSGSDAVSKSGGLLDPAGQPQPSGSPVSCDNGGTLDPAGNCNP